MTRTRRLLGGISYGYLNAAVAMVGGLWLTPFLLRRLGVSDVGLWFAVQQLLGYVMLLDLGVVALLPRETAVLTGRPESAERAVQDLVGQTLRVVLWQMPVVALLAGGVWLLLPAEWAAVHRPAAILLAAFVLLFPARVLHGLLYGLQDLAFIGRIQLWIWTINFGVIVALVLAGYGLYSLAIAWAASQLFAAAAWGLRLKRRFPTTLPARMPSLRRSFVRDRAGKGLWVSTGQVAQVFLNGSDLVVIGYVLGPAAIVPYACTGKLISVLANQPQLIMQAAAPALSQLRAAESTTRLESVSSALTQAMLLVSGAIVCVVVATNGAFVSWWVGSEQYGGFTLTLLLAVAMLLRHWNTTTVYALFTRGYDRHLSLVTFADGAVTIVAALIGVHWLGLIGAPIAAIVGASCVGLPWNLRALARDADVSVFHLVFRIRSWAVRFGLVLAVSALLGATWQPEGFLTTGAVAAGILAMYSVVAGPIALRAPLEPYVRPWLAWR